MNGMGGEDDTIGDLDIFINILQMHIKVTVNYQDKIINLCSKYVRL